jgi:hypothetical protein
VCQSDAIDRALRPRMGLPIRALLLQNCATQDGAPGDNVAGRTGGHRRPKWRMSKGTLRRKNVLVCPITAERGPGSSSRVMQKHNFKCQGYVPKQCFDPGHPRDTVTMSLGC